MERNSEKSIVWAVVGILGMKILGVDVQQLIAIATVAQDAVVQVNAATGIGADELVLGGAAGLYTWCRTKIKETREKIASGGGDRNA